MEEKKVLEQEVQEEEKSFFDLQSIIKTLILEWKWFLLFALIGLACAYVYNRYTTPIYQVAAKLMVKSDAVSSRSNNRLAGITGAINTIDGMQNEMVILKSHSLATDVVRDLKLYITYKSEGRVSERLLYKSQPILVDIDEAHLNRLSAPIELRVEREGGAYHVTGTYVVTTNTGGIRGPYGLDKKFTTLPYRIPTSAGIIAFNASPYGTMRNGDVINITIAPPAKASYAFAAALSTGSQEGTSLINLMLRDENVQRATDYLNHIATCYNRQANEDKNQIAIRTEQFINSRIEKINHELGSTGSAIESYKRRNHMVELKTDATQAASGARATEQKLADMESQLLLLKDLITYIDDPANKYQLLPTNFGLNDPTSSGIINKYNEIVLERNRLMRSAGENNPSIQPYTIQLDNFMNSLRNALAQARRTFEIQRGIVTNQLNEYYNRIDQTPEQERVLTEIGRQHELKSGIYLMLLQRREENSISLAATADKGKLIDEPVFAGVLGTKNNIIYLIGLIIGLLIPACYFFIKSLLRYKIEGHEDVTRLTKLPVIADVPIASETAKTRADIVVHENQNNQMEEVFRSMRTNLNFMLSDNQKVILFTSTTSGEGKTFNAANLAVSYALLDKKVIIVGLDIRKPRLAELFEIKDHHHGITPLLAHDAPTLEDVRAQIIPSEVHRNLDLLLAGPIPPNPAELVARPSLEIIVNHLRDTYDYVIIDSAPVGLVTDTLQIGRVADSTIYMCRADYTPKASFSMVNSLAEEEKLPNISIVINGIDMSRKKYGYYYGYGKYGKYAKYGNYYGKYGRYGRYGRYGGYGSYGGYGYGNYHNSNYGNKNDDSVKLK